MHWYYLLFSEYRCIRIISQAITAETKTTIVEKYTVEVLKATLSE